MAPQHIANRRGDIGWGEVCGGYLIEQWLKDIVIVAVDDRDLYGRMSQRERRLQAAEARADDHHTWRLAVAPLWRCIPEEIPSVSYMMSLAFLFQSRL